MAIFILPFLLVLTTTAFGEVFHFQSEPPPRDSGITWSPGHVTRFELNTLPYSKPASQLKNGCPGFIAESPTMELHIEEQGEGVIRVESSNDPVMVIQSPDGGFHCVDDYQQLNPGFKHKFQPGTWLIWVGTLRPELPFPYTLVLE